ncbi:MAG: zinc transporter ZntB [Acidiferrobacterales bacterium]
MGAHNGNNDGIICSYLLDRKGRGQEISRAELGTNNFSGRLLWVHLDRAGTEGKLWLDEQSGVDPFVCDGLFESADVSTERWISEGRPRCIVFEDGVIINLRGANLNPGAVANDMVVVRLWISPDKIISVRRRHMMAIDDIRESMAEGKGPRGPSEFVIMLTARLLERMGPVLAKFQRLVDDLEQVMITARNIELRSQIVELRRDAIEWRRHIAPQRRALESLMTAQVSWLGENDRTLLLDLIQDITKHVEDLDGVRERAIIIQDEISNQLSEQMNRTMFQLSLIAATFLPLGFLTGLLSMNLAGVPIPGASTPWAFWIVCTLLFVVGGVAVLVFRRLKWM